MRDKMEEEKALSEEPYRYAPINHAGDDRHDIQLTPILFKVNVRCSFSITSCAKEKGRTILKACIPICRKTVSSSGLMFDTKYRKSSFGRSHKTKLMYAVPTNVNPRFMTKLFSSFNPQEDIEKWKDRFEVGCIILRLCSTLGIRLSPQSELELSTVTIESRGNDASNLLSVIRTRDRSKLYTLTSWKFIQNRGKWTSSLTQVLWL